MPEPAQERTLYSGGTVLPLAGNAERCEAIVIERNPPICTPDELRATTVMQTLFNGQLVWGSGAL